MAFDPNYSDIWLLLRLNGSDGATSFPDTSMFPKIATAYGSVQIDTAYSAYGGASALFNGSTDYLKYGDTADCKFLHDGTAFTLEFQAKVTHTGGTQVVMDSTASSAAGITIFRNSSTGQLIFYMRNASGTNILDGGNLGIMMDDGVFHHYRFTFDPSLPSAQLKLAIDSVFSASNDITGVASTGIAGNPLHIGVNFGLTQFFTGHLDDIRITKGVVRDPSGFTVEESGDLADSVGEFDITGILPVVSGRSGFGLRVLFPLDKIAVDFRGAGRAAIAAVQPSIALRGAGRMVLQAAKPVVFVSGHPGTDNFFVPIIAPKPIVVARGAGRLKADAPAAVVMIAGTNVHFGRVSISAPLPLVAASGTPGSIGRIAVRALPIAVSGRGAGRVAVKALSPVVQGSAIGGHVARLKVVAPAPVVLIQAGLVSHGVLNAIAPIAALLNGGRLRVVAPTPMVHGDGGPVVDVTYEAYSINLEMSDKVGLVYPATRYTNFPFDRVVRWGNDYFGVARTGLYRLGGATDYATPEPLAIAYDWKTHSTDNEVPERKTLSEVFLSGRIGATANLRVYANDDEAREYAYAVNRDATARNYRQKFGKGIKARYVAMGMDGDEELELDTVHPEIVNLTRRLGK